MRQELVKGSYGFTTGTCAAAAAKGATLALFLGVRPGKVEVRLPCGEEVSLPLSGVIVKRKAASCSVVKKGVEKGDVTSGIRLVATVIRRASPYVSVTGGRGIGVVTKPGLEIPVGERAINPVPRAMIMREVKEVLRLAGAEKGCLVIISVPGGERIGERTLNPRLGVLGGISILGTSGLVIPYSAEAYADAMKKSLDVARACGNDSVVLCTGRRSEALARRHMDLPEECFVICGDRFRLALDHCVRLDFGFVSIWAMPGKMTKLASGSTDLHSDRGLPDIGFLTRCLYGRSKTPLADPDSEKAVTARAFLERLSPCDRDALYRILCLLAALRVREHLGGGTLVQCNLVTREEGLVASACA